MVSNDSGSCLCQRCCVMVVCVEACENIFSSEILLFLYIIICIHNKVLFLEMYLREPILRPSPWPTTTAALLRVDDRKGYPVIIL